MGQIAEAERSFHLAALINNGGPLDKALLTSIDQEPGNFLCLPYLHRRECSLYKELVAHAADVNVYASPQWRQPALKASGYAPPYRALSASPSRRLSCGCSFLGAPFFRAPFQFRFPLREQPLHQHLNFTGRASFPRHAGHAEVLPHVRIYRDIRSYFH